ncbi:hypothetical protein R1sor_024379 [Riccia sorocarpa]|uniref:Sugar phosphate transporter domain-containing protein n=1 Tax=Riccia sorocarpa TaxID=122646 RepID=A0ABD3GQD2_9MARC
MGPDGFVELHAEPMKGNRSEEAEDNPSNQDGSMGEPNYRSLSYAGLENRYSHQPDLDEVSLSSGGSRGGSPGGSPKASSGSEVLTGQARSKSKKEGNGLRAKRGGKALKINVTSPKEQEQRRKALYLESLAGSAPLYPLDLQELSAESVYDDAESDRSSIFSPEVAANGFGSPIELPSRDNFEDQLNRRLEAERRMQADGLTRDQRENGSLDEIPPSKFDSLTNSQADKFYDDTVLSVEESFLPDGGSLTSYILKTLILVLVWYIFSTLLTLYNKVLLGMHRGHFPAPLLMNTIHFLMQAVISTVVVRYIKPSLLPTVGITWKDYCMRVVPTALATALDIDLTNVSLVFISVTFATMCKSGAPVFLLLFAFAFKLETPSYKLLGIMLIIAFGVMLTVSKETEFNVAGFILVMAAAIMSGFRWTVTQLLLQMKYILKRWIFLVHFFICAGLNNPYAVMSYLTPVMAAASMILSLILEPWTKLGESHYFDTPEHVLSSCALMLLGGGLAFCMVSAEYLLISKTSAIALTVAGVVKEVVTIMVAVMFLRDNFTMLKGIGLGVIIIGVSLFNWLRYQKLVHGGSGEHGLSHQNQNHSYVALKENHAVFEVGDELDEDIL